jgi:hypothetical protein
MKRFMTLLSILMLTLMLFAFQNPQDIDEPPGQEGRLFSARLRGEAEVPGPGDPDGTGSARVRLNPKEGEVCFRIQVSNIALPATAAHIHIGTPNFAGPVVVTLGAPDAEGNSEGCASDQDPGVLRLIIDNPGVFYVNVHNAEFPAGAVRGHLSRD